MNILNLPEELRSNIFSYSNVPRTASTILENDPMYLFQELLNIEPNFDIATILQQVRLRQRELRRLKKQPVYQLYRLLEHYDPIFKVQGLPNTQSYTITTTQDFSDIMKNNGFELLNDFGLATGDIRDYLISGISNLPMELDIIDTYLDLTLKEPGLSKLQEMIIPGLRPMKTYIFSWK